MVAVTEEEGEVKVLENVLIILFVCYYMKYSWCLRLSNNHNLGLSHIIYILHNTFFTVLSRDQITFLLQKNSVQRRQFCET